MTTKTSNSASASKGRQAAAEAAQVARQQVLDQRATLARWEVQAAAAASELAALQDQVGAAVLDRPDSATDLADRLGRLHADLDIATRAVDAQRPRVTAAESSYLTCEADLLEFDADEATKRLKAHTDHTAKLLAQLEEHEGKFVPETELISVMQSANVLGVPTEWLTPKSWMLQAGADVAELRVAILREMAGGGDPAPIVESAASIIDGTVHGVPVAEVYPAVVWGPDALCPAPAWVRANGGA